MKSLILLSTLFSVSAFSASIQKCEPTTMPSYVCLAVPSNDGIYRLTQSPITVCHGNNKTLIVSKSSTRDVYNSELKETAKNATYTIFDLEDKTTPVAQLKINKLAPSKSTFQFIGDDRHQVRICKKTR